MDKKEQFENWLEDTKFLSIKSCKNYSSAVTKISKDLIASGKSLNSLYDISDHSEIVKLSNIYWTPEMIIKDKEKWKRMYSNGFRHYLEFSESINSEVKITAVKDRVIKTVELSTKNIKSSINTEINEREKRVNWVREELLLTLELYILECTTGTKGLLDADHPKCIKMSQLLNSLPMHSERSTNKLFRSKNAVSTRLANWRYIDPNIEGGLRGVTKDMYGIWDEYYGKLDELQSITKNIKSSINTETKEDTSNHKSNESIIDKQPRSRLSVINSLVTDRKLSNWVKDTYKNTCQICNEQLQIPKRYYSEAAHIRAKSDGGLDSTENILCLCANCHALFDQGAYWLDDEMNIVHFKKGLQGKLFVEKSHKINISNIRFHRNKFHS